MKKASSPSRSVQTAGADKKRRARLSSILRPVLEHLENRTLLSTSIALNNGVLTLTGDPALANHLVVSISASGKTLTARAGKHDFITELASDVQEISIVGGAGNDLIVVQPKITLPVVVNSGDGSDTIRTGAGADTITAGNGNDRIFAGN